MIVIVEGIDRVGKTTLVKMLEKAGFTSFKDKFMVHNPGDPVTGGFSTEVINFKDFSSGKLDTTLRMLKVLNENGQNIVVDRFHLTEFVYGIVEREGTNSQFITAIDKELSRMGAVLVYVRPTNIMWSSDQAGKNLGPHSEYFDWAVNMSEIQVVRCDYYTLGNAFQQVISMSADYDIYFASPFFNDEQREREQRLKARLRSFGFRVFSPSENSGLKPNSSQQDREAVFKGNCDAINNAKMVFAITDGKDVGTIWEAGYAYAIDKPIAYYAETLGSNQFNLMLAQSGVAVFKDMEEVTPLTISKVIYGDETPFTGDIE